MTKFDVPWCSSADFHKCIKRLRDRTKDIRRHSHWWGAKAQPDATLCMWSVAQCYVVMFVKQSSLMYGHVEWTAHLLCKAIPDGCCNALPLSCCLSFSLAYSFCHSCIIPNEPATPSRNAQNCMMTLIYGQSCQLHNHYIGNSIAFTSNLVLMLIIPAFWLLQHASFGSQGWLMNW